VSDGESVISWPEEHRPEGADLHAVNELQMEAPRANVWAWLVRPDLWPRYYSNARFVRHRAGAWPEVALYSSFRWLTFGVLVNSEIVEYDPNQRLAWSAEELGARGHHAWVLADRDGGTFVHTEETQRGWGMKIAKPVMSRLMVKQHQKWLEGLARVAAEGPPPPPDA
jgi:uncharacterized protein YndB with AHSA1/START domain